MHQAAVLFPTFHIHSAFCSVAIYGTLNDRGICGITAEITEIKREIQLTRLSTSSVGVLRGSGRERSGGSPAQQVAATRPLSRDHAAAAPHVTPGIADPTLSTAGSPGTLLLPDSHFQEGQSVSVAQPVLVLHREHNTVPVLQWPPGPPALLEHWKIHSIQQLDPLQFSLNWETLNLGICDPQNKALYTVPRRHKLLAQSGENLQCSAATMSLQLLLPGILKLIGTLSQV